MYINCVEDRARVFSISLSLMTMTNIHCSSCGGQRRSSEAFGRLRVVNGGVGRASPTVMLEVGQNLFLRCRLAPRRAAGTLWLSGLWSRDPPSPVQTGNQ